MWPDRANQRTARIRKLVATESEASGRSKTLSGNHSDDIAPEIEEGPVDSNGDGEIVEQRKGGEHVAYVVIPAKTGKRHTVVGDLGDAHKALGVLNSGKDE
ncbi:MULTISPECIES: hypothetical protein [unclassified Mesorhizobium]|uniref:hypothetical protein n=1 Tax=unclassified Mesorhizobium TaxID=325217 RepID=UPI003338C76B